MKKQLREDDFQILKNYIKELGFSAVYAKMNIENTYINGATMYEINELADGVRLRYMEDDLCDEEGNPYILEIPYFKAFGDFKPGKRLLAIYVNGNYHTILPVNGQVFKFTGAYNDDYINKLDKRKSIRIPSPFVLNLPKTEARIIEERDIAGIKLAIKKYKRYKGAVIIATIAMSILWLIILGLICIFSANAIFNHTSINQAMILPYMAFYLILFIIAIIFTVKFFNNIYLKRVLRMKYIKPVMYAGMSTGMSISATYGQTVGIYEWCDNQIIYRNIPVGIGTYFFTKNIKYGDIINMLTLNEKYDLKLVSNVVLCQNDDELKV